MLKHVLTSLLGLFSIAALAQDKIKLTQENTVVLNWVVEDQSIAKLTQQIFELSAELPKDKPIYLVLDTPGGSVPAGTNFIDSVKGVPQEIKTISLFAASMGFQIAENLGERLVTDNSTMMSHLAAGGLEGTIPGSVNTRLAFWEGIIGQLDSNAAKRLKLSESAYMRKIQNEYWVHGSDNVKQGLADRVVVLSCDKSLNGTTTEEIPTIFGTVVVERARCPLVRGVISAKVAGQASRLEESNAYKAFLLFLNDKSGFTEQFIVTGKFGSLGF